MLALTLRCLPPLGLVLVLDKSVSLDRLGVRYADISQEHCLHRAESKFGVTAVKHFALGLTISMRQATPY